MVEYRQNPVVVEAIQYHESMRLNDRLPTLEGDMTVINKDFTITGIKGFLVVSMNTGDES